MSQPKNATENILMSITKFIETLIHQTHRKAEETLEFKLAKSRELIHFNSPIQTKGDWIIGLMSLEAYKFIFNITEQNKKFELHEFPDQKSGGISYENVRDEIEKNWEISDITAIDLQDEIMAPIFLKSIENNLQKKMKDDGYMKFLAGYIRSIFQDFESYHRTEVDLVEDDIRLVSDENNSSSTFYDLQPGVYTFEKVSEALFKILHSKYPGPSNVIVIEIDDISMKTKMVLRDGVIAVRFDEK